jgi:streptogramin lyase
MNTRLVTSAGILAASVALAAGCNGGGSSAPKMPLPPVGASGVPAPYTGPQASAKITITVPRASSPARQKTRHYVSPSTQSVVVTVAGSPEPAYNIGANLSGCTASASATTCTFSVSAPVGTAVPFSVVSYDQQNGAGNALSSGSTTSTIVMDSANTVTLTLQGIVSQVAFTLPKPVPACSPTTAPLGIEGLDADGNVISGTYATPVTLTDSNATVTTFTPATIASSATTSGTFTYSGGSSGVATITAKTGSTIVGSTTFVPTPTICAEYALTEEAVAGTASTGPGPRGIVGAGDYLYVADFSIAMISRVNSTLSAPTGTIVPIPLTDILTTETAATPNEEAIGPDGNLWVTDPANGIDMVSLASAVSFTTQNVYSQDGAGSQGAEQPEGIVTGPGAASTAKLYFANAVANQIATVTTAGVFTEYPIAPTASPATPIPSAVPTATATATAAATPIPNKKPEGITVGPDGNLWFCEQFNNAIGVISPTGTLLHEYPVTTPMAEPYFLTTGPDGAIWFTEFAAGQIGRIDTSSGAVTEYTIGNNAVPIQIVSGLDGNLYFTDTGNNAIGRITPAGSISLYPVPTAKGDPFGITVGPDNNIWFTESSGGNVGYLAY